MGYLNKPNETKGIMTNENWLKLGDLGYLDEDSYLSVLGKQENFITLSTGEVISPFRVKSTLTFFIFLMVQSRF